MDRPRYDHIRIEKKWQKFWEDQETFKVDVDHSKPKYYILDMFPYPSGAGLHVGHVTGYTATDILARYKRQQGFNVLHPMGWDSFGLPAEQYAIKTGTHPSVTAEQNINTYRRQLKSLGFSYDWSREVATSDPKYYKWTQWIFTKLYEKGLAYEAEMQVNFCPFLGTVLANEEVENGRSKEGGYPVERRPLRQWILKITAYADKLLEDLDLLDWPDHLKKLQVNWIGKSRGSKVNFIEEKSGSAIPVFTTCHHTLFGVTFIVLAPEHPLVPSITTKEQRAAIDAYQKEVVNKTDFQRGEVNKDKSGVWTGGYAINPVNGARIPIWIADYVLMGYGTGAVMGVPAHDERDFEFAKKYNLLVQPVVDPEPSSDEDFAPEGLTFANVRVEVLAGNRCWSKGGLLINSAHKDLSLNGLSAEDAKERVLNWLIKNEKGEEAINYKLRDWLFSRQRYWGEPIPIIHLEGGKQRALGLDELPLCPPQLADFKPSPTGESPLARVQEWVHIQDIKTGKKAWRETNTMPQWAGSCWYYLRFCDPLNDKAAWDKEIEKYWMPVDMYVGGVEHAVLHLLYARFWHKVLYDSGLVSTPEPFQTLRNQGLVIAKSFRLPGGAYISPEEVREEKGRYFQIGTDQELEVLTEKMSKSKLNGVTPDEMIEEFGADSLRLYEMFMGPFDKEKLWNTDAVTGCRRFLSRFYDLLHSEKASDEETEEAMKLTHRLISQVQRDIEAMQFNTAIAKMMEFMNNFAPLPNYPKSALRILAQLLSPFAPHIAEEAWQHLGGKETLTFAPFPKVNPLYLIDEMVTYIIQVNGRLRGRWELPKDKSQEELLKFIETQPQIAKHVKGEIQKVIFVPNKLMNLVIADAS
ncbi:MAG: leucine--tRNA ligase [Chlamydiales bacterium]|nr:leucine--tRNA ligase [Chlamydiales bacterium]